jgi:hypothetical protein
MIKLLVLDGCKRCEGLKKELNKREIYFQYEICKSNTAICDTIEDMIDCSNYPIALLIESNKIHKVVYITDNYDDVGKKIRLDNGVMLLPVYSIDQLINSIIN